MYDLESLIEERNYCAKELRKSLRTSTILFFLLCLSIFINFVQFDNFRDMKAELNAKIMQYEIFYNDAIQKDEARI